ncbi:hypothetical protein CH63R_12374 [Colletotrichum higginsianum IMI 349063]|uniref:Uncharacterized protein n=1 Tax=Colletotrichum higginsianum (strain IMI 349063) TaxID=759273 RepID=A0A1B7XU05_COLHI|nr:hypothetical protein CH63R_12374 [Colletotrichum higginsianum IMI 349063]OBR03247.1 hypothetical protein CH63R_12374 [Colletotrichum higginsianum IMI 349063]GJD02398.1 hypothetical protein ColKHC_11223 [Colletotrichum higginsianum]
MKSLLILGLATLSLCTPTPSNSSPVDPKDQEIGKRAGAGSLTTGYWSCTIPNGAVYTRGQDVLNECGSGFKKQYFVINPRDNLLSCFTHDSVENVLNVCGSTGFVKRYRLRKPADKIEACSVPSDFVFSSVRSTLNVCSTNGFAPIYTLRKPADKIEACSVPSGFTFSSTRKTLNVCNSNGFATIYYLRTPSVGLKACSVPRGWGSSSSERVLGVCSPTEFATQYTLKKL